MDWVTNIYANYPLLVWLAIAALFLAAEVASGSGWLLWPAGAAAVVAVLTFILPDNLMIELAVFAALTGVSALFGRRFLPKTMGEGPDINDNFARLVGKQGSAVSTFEHGQGRVFIDGKEWAAVAEGSSPDMGQKVEVVAAEGAVLRVRAA
jgi:membrane protein implicated in regulation of membrane protease activity